MFSRWQNRRHLALFVAGAVLDRCFRQHPALDRSFGQYPSLGPRACSFLGLARIPALVVSPVRCRAVRRDGECFTQGFP
jgi:hypothetical protein